MILNQQRNELTEHIIYTKLANSSKNPHNKKILLEIGKDELKHHNFWQSITKQKVKPKRIKIIYYTFISKIFGLAFGLKLMESGEENAQEFYEKLIPKYPQVKEIVKEEEKHEKSLVRILEDEKLNYAGSIVLGLNDALVELTGTLTGLSMAFQSTLSIGISGLIMGIAASLSMAASGFLSSQENNSKELSAKKSAIYTGFAYIITVLLLTAPYFLFDSVKYALITMLLLTLVIISSYTFYISVAKEVSFKERFIQMTLISLGVTLISFSVGFLIKNIFGINL